MSTYSLFKRTPKQNKVKVIVKDFENYRNLLPKIGFYQSKFSVFKVSTDFEVMSENNQESESKELISFKESFRDYLENNNVDSKIKEILEEEIK